jgi:Protein of unknown function (DUF3489)
MRKPAQKGSTEDSMTIETTNTSATVAETGAHVAPAKPAPKKGATRK